MLIAALHRRGVRLPRWIGIVLLAAVSVALCAGMLLAQGPSPYAFVFLVGSDTLGVERVTPAAGMLVGDLQLRGQPRVQWTGSFSATGRLTTLRLNVYRSGAPDAPVLQRATLTLDGDTVRVELSSPEGASTKQAIATKRDALMLVNASVAMTDLIVGAARATPAPVDTITLFGATGGQTLPGVVTIAGDSAMVTIGPTVSTARLASNGTVQELAVPAQRLRAVRVEGAAYTALRIGGPDYSAPAGAPYRAEQVTIPATGGHTLAATLTLPAGSGGRVPVVVSITGSGPQDRDEYIPLAPGYRPYRQFADSLGRRGIAMLRFDDRGTGASTGDHGKATSADFANDVRSVVAWLRQRPDIDADRIVLMGHSEGGMIAPMVAATDSRLAGIVLLAGPSQSGETILRFQLRNLAVRDTSLTAQRRDSAIAAIDATIASLKKTNPWMKFFLEYDPIPTARQVRVPAFVVQGGTDQQVTPEQAEALATAMRTGGNKDVRVLVLKDRNHLFLPDPDGYPGNYVNLPSGRLGGDVLGPVVDWVVLKAAATRKGVM